MPLPVLVTTSLQRYGPHTSSCAEDLGRGLVFGNIPTATFTWYVFNHSFLTYSIGVRFMYPRITSDQLLCPLIKLWNFDGNCLHMAIHKIQIAELPTRPLARRPPPSSQTDAGAGARRRQAVALLWTLLAGDRELATSPHPQPDLHLACPGVSFRLAFWNRLRHRPAECRCAHRCDDHPTVPVLESISG